MQNRTKKFDDENFISGENRWRYLFDQLQTLTSMFWLECPDIKSNFFFFFGDDFFGRKDQCSPMVPLFSIRTFILT